MRRRAAIVVLAGVATGLLAPPGPAGAVPGRPAAVAGRASAARPVLPLPPLVSLRQRVLTVRAPGFVGSRQVVSAVTGVSAPVSRRIAADVTAVGAAIVRPHRADAFDHVDVRAYVVEQDLRYVTVELSVVFYATGAAHPISEVRTLVYQRGTARRLELRDLFGGSAAAMRVLSAQTRRLLPSALGGLPPYAEGTAPVAANFAHLVPRSWGLDVVFDQGVVNAEAFGVVDVVVPWGPLLPYLRQPLPLSALPAPPYSGGQSVPQDEAQAVAALTRQLPTPAGGLRVEDIRFALDGGPSGVTYLVARRAPVVRPAAVTTVLMRDTGSGPQVVRSAAGPLSCTGLPALVLRQLRLVCSGR